MYKICHAKQPATLNTTGPQLQTTHWLAQLAFIFKYLNPHPLTDNSKVVLPKGMRGRIHWLSVNVITSMENSFLTDGYASYFAYSNGQHNLSCMNQETASWHCLITKAAYENLTQFTLLPSVSKSILSGTL